MTDQLDQIYNLINTKLDHLYQQYDHDIIECFKIRCKMSYEERKKNIAKYKTINNLHFEQIFVKLLETETGFVYHKTKDIIGTNKVIITQNGYRAIKIIGTNVNKIDNSIDPDYYETYSIIEIMEKFKNYVDKTISLPFGKQPELIALFYEDPNLETCIEIHKMGIIVKSIKDIPLHLISQKINIANLDTTTLITLCTDLENSRNLPSEKTNKYLAERKFGSIDDAVNYKKALYQEIMQYETIIVCQTAWNTFSNIISNVGGPKEKISFMELEKIIKIVPDQIHPRIMKMTKMRNDMYKIVVGTAETYHAITYTGNESFVNSAKRENIYLMIRVHKSIKLLEKYT